MQPCLEKMRFNEQLGNLSFFEVYTAIAFKYFLEKKLDYVVLETGLGGRLDATNVVTPLVAIITHLGYDHTDKLGNTLAKIAAEKAGIIKKEIPTVSSSQRQSALKIIKAKCRKAKSELYLLGRDFKTEKISLRKSYTFFDFKSKNLNLRNLRIYLKGKCQVENASLAIMAISILEERGLIGTEAKFKQGSASAFFAGRFEIVLNKPLVTVDVAHNPSAFYVLRENLRRYFPDKKIILIFAASRDKDIKRMLKILPFSEIIITAFSNPRAFTPLEIKNICGLKSAYIAKDVKEAFILAKSLYKPKSLILISGSLFLVGEAKKLLQQVSNTIHCDELGPKKL
jgi:dihydrofolate synthase/folylpolyglutamate synthase